jgi:argininosuccinate lyase
MLKLANQKLAEQDAWIKEKRAKISASLAKLDADFAKLMNSGK